MERIESPHLEIEGSGGPAGTLLGHVHRSCPVEGLTFQCPARSAVTGEACGHVYQVGWVELDLLNEPLLELLPCECIHLPPCPSCGALQQLVLHDVEYGTDLPQHFTMKMVREHIAVRPAFSKLTCCAASATDGKYQGRDFSHLAKRDRPDCHEQVDLAQELRLRREKHEGRRVSSSGNDTSQLEAQGGGSGFHTVAGEAVHPS